MDCLRGLLLLEIFQKLIFLYAKMKIFETSLFHVFFVSMEQYSLLKEIWKGILPFHFSTV